LSAVPSRRRVVSREESARRKAPGSGGLVSADTRLSKPASIPAPMGFGRSFSRTDRTEVDGG
jgi:hypothetical protein